MHFYPHNIKDFRSGTVSMTRMERWLYRDLLDCYYDTEQPLPLDVDKVCRMIGAREAQEKAAVAEILDFKFTKTDAGYAQERCDAEIAAYHAKAATAQENGKKGGRPPKNRKPGAPEPEAEDNPEKPSGFSVGSNPDAIGNPTETGSKTNQEPVTNNHSNTPHTPQGGRPSGSRKRDGKPAIEFKTFMANCRESGEKPIPEGDSIFQYAEDAGIEREWLALAWFEFKERHMEKNKRQADWRATFRNYVRNNWFKLWFMRQDGTCGLTTQGMQAKAVFDSKAAK
ncbi:YdaU family protein [Paraburkholderia sediminicola]|uniref:YdaU family protein n=1 Tax=Paraburkholderia sediminicola TaxID=458836 RepID=UPI0038BCE2EA